MENVLSALPQVLSHNRLSRLPKLPARGGLVIFYNNGIVCA